MRIGYTTDCRFFSDRPDVVSKVKWIPCAKGAPALGVPSVICNRMLDDEPYLFDDLGEVWRAKRPPNNAKPIPGADGKHVCGTPEEFAAGCVRDESLPPVIYTTSGLPRCCNPANVGRGGIGIGGLSVPSVVPAAPAGGVDCDTAGALTIGTTYTLTIPPGGGHLWWKASTSSAGVHKVTLANWTNAVQMTWFTGTVCAFLGATKVYNAAGCQSALTPHPRIIALRFTQHATLTQTVDVTIGLGAC